MRRQLPNLQRVVSGGQTGVDRAALDWAIAAGLPQGGACPKGRKAEDGVIPDCYQLIETPSAQYNVRTHRNMMDADATLILNLGELGGGTRLTAYLCQKTGKPCRVVQLDGEDIDTDVLGTREWLQANAVTSLNVAGPRESKRPGAYAAARRFLSLLAGEERAVMGSTRPMADTM